jgi:hypothetical protein
LRAITSLEDADMFPLLFTSREVSIKIIGLDVPELMHGAFGHGSRRAVHRAEMCGSAVVSKKSCEFVDAHRVSDEITLRPVATGRRNIFFLLLRFDPLGDDA